MFISRLPGSPESHFCSGESEGGMDLEDHLEEVLVLLFWLHFFMENVKHARSRENNGVNVHVYLSPSFNSDQHFAISPLPPFSPGVFIFYCCF